MAAAFFREGVGGAATFSLFVRRLPRERGFLVAAGLEDVLEYLRALRFGAGAMDYLRARAASSRHSWSSWAAPFTGDVRAVREGTVLFADEPLLEITAPLIEAQLLETAVINFCHLQTVQASKAARSVLAARGRTLAEFGLRRSHGMDAGMKAARAAMLAGFDSTSNVLAGRTWGVPLSARWPTRSSPRSPASGTRSWPTRAPFPGARCCCWTPTTRWPRHARRSKSRGCWRPRGHRLAGVRLDSGDLGALSREVRRSSTLAAPPTSPSS